MRPELSPYEAKETLYRLAYSREPTSDPSNGEGELPGEYWEKQEGSKYETGGYPKVVWNGIERDKSVGDHTSNEHQLHVNNEKRAEKDNINIVVPLGSEHLEGNRTDNRLWLFVIDVDHAFDLEIEKVKNYITGLGKDATELSACEEREDMYSDQIPIYGPFDTSESGNRTTEDGSNPGDKDDIHSGKSLGWRDKKTRDAPYTLRMISQGRGQPVPKQYYYDSSDGEGVNVYVVGCGCDLMHTEFAHIEQDSWRVIWGDGSKDGKKMIDESGFGTAVASLIFGKTAGTARNAKPISVIVNNGDQVDPVFYLTAIARMIEDIEKQGDKMMAVISMSIGFVAPGQSSTKGALYSILAQQFKALLEMKNVLITVSPIGSGAMGPAIYFPGNMDMEFAATRSNIISVGGTDQQGKLVTPLAGSISAPVVDVWVAAIASQKPQADGGRQGSSFEIAASTVAGVLATFISKGHSPRQAKILLYQNAYSRDPADSKVDPKPVYPPVVYNGEDPNGEPVDPKVYEKIDRLSTLSDDDFYQLDDVNYLGPASIKVDPKPEKEDDTNGNEAIVTVYPPNCSKPARRRDAPNPELSGREVSSEDVGKAKPRKTRTVMRSCEEATPAPEMPSIRDDFTPTSQSIAPMSTIAWVYNQTFCDVCKEANGEVPINGVIWIPTDCPCM
ncbi:hypothetical protein ABW21_db0200644 [Orbilia brochopaga]|nr:hypothetical protein ABW21_db0200644 [Drechslerella brochopaga]